MIREHRNPKNKLKLSPLGQAYSTKLKNSHKTKVSLKDEKVKFEDLMIITPLVNDDLFIETGLQKHLLVVYDSSIDKYIATHYLTRKPTAEKLCDKEFKIFQNEQQYPEIVEDLAGDKRPQYAIFYKKPHETSGESVDPIVDAEKTKKLLAIMKEIEKNNK